MRKVNEFQKEKNKAYLTEEYYRHRQTEIELTSKIKELEEKNAELEDNLQELGCKLDDISNLAKHD